MSAQEIAKQKKMTEIVNQYRDLVEKITLQQWQQLSPRQKEVLEIDDIRGYAYEGFALALQKYDPTKSTMTFQQYLAYSMRNACLNGINDDSRTITISYYESQKRKEQGLPTVITKSIHEILSPSSEDEDDDNTDHLSFLGVEGGFDNGEHPVDTLVKAIKAKFDDTYSDIFFSTFGLDGHEELKGVELAKKYNVSNATITVRVQKVISFIQSDADLMSTLAELL